MTKSSSYFTFNLLLLSFSLIFFTQCEKDKDKDDDTFSASGQVTIEMTDAPIDNAEVTGAFVTVTDVKIDDESINLSNKQTIDILAYQNGDTKSLGIAELEPGTYSNITIVLDYATDQEGNSPGCYVLTNSNEKYDLSTNSNASNEITFSTNNLSVTENVNTNIVIDFDLRKAIKEEENNVSEKYTFVSDTELRSSFRTAFKAQTGTIQGNCTNANDYGDRVVVYAYKKGSYNEDSEVQGQGNSNVTFANAVTSSTVDANGSFSLHFLEEGDYETHFIVYEDSDNDGSIEIKGKLEFDLIGSIIDLLSLEVQATATVSANITAIGVLPL